MVRIHEDAGGICLVKIRGDMTLKVLGVALGAFVALAQSQTNPPARPQFDVAGQFARSEIR